MSTQSSLQSLLEARTNLGILHARTFEARPSQNRKPKSILELVATGCPTAQKQQLVYVVADLKRSSNNESWGISFSQFDGHMILGEVKTRMKQRITWSAVILGNEHILDHKQVYQSAKTQPSRAQYREIVKYYARSIQTAGCTVHNQVLPGDMIVAIDGFQPNEFSSLHEITNYLRNSIHLSLILVRHPQPTAAALALYSMPSLNAAHNQSGTAAYHVWRVLLDPIAPIARQVPMARQVTPDVGAAAAAASRNSSLMVSHMDPIAHLGLRLQQSLWNQKLLSNLAAGNGTALSLSPHHAMAAPHFKPIHNIKKRPLVPTTTTIPPLPDTWRNPWFQKDNRSIPYDDNWEFSPEDGNRAQLFLPPIHDFQYWLRLRKNKWRRNYKVFKHLNKDDHEDDHEDETLERDSCTVSKDFWTHQGLSSFDAWLQHRRERWRTNYKVYRNKRRRIHKECEEIVHLNNPSMEAFNHWLQIRKNQWKVLRRKRQRQREENKRGPIEIETRKAPNNEVTEVTAAAAHNPAAVVTPDKQDRGLDCTLQRKRRKFLSTSATDIDMACIDDILEEEERERKARAERPPIDISFLFDANKMAPDDVVVRVFEYLDRKEHGKLLCVNKETSESLKARDDVWRQLCPSNWVLPRRPRKPWHEIYISMLRREQHDCQKRWDDLLLKCYAVLLKGDHLQKIEKLVFKGEAAFGFDANYVSPVVCERNCLLNLAVIQQRHKVVRWLVDQKGAAIESYDRGHFTPLLNAAWAGHKQTVRFLLQRGANRSKVGFYHYSKPLSSPDFAGLSAEGWARRQGHDSIAELIRLGL